MSRITAPRYDNKSRAWSAVRDAMLIRLQCAIADFDPLGRPRMDEYGKLKLRTPTHEAIALSSMPMMDLAEQYLRMVSPSVANSMPSSRGAMFQFMFDRAALSRYFPEVRHQDGWRAPVALSGATGDLPGLMADVQARRVWRSWCRRAETADFKERKVVALEDIGRLPELKEGEEIKFFAIKERSSQSYGLVEYAAGAMITRQAMLNDDVDVLAQIPARFAEAAARLEDWQAHTVVLEGNPVMGDGSALFATAHANLTTGTLSVGSLGSARTKMARQTTTDGDVLDIAGRVLIVPPELSTTAEQVMDSTGRNSRVLGEPPIEVAMTPHLASATQWYLAADPAMLPAAEMLFLASEPEPQITSRIEFASGGMQVRCTHCVAAAPIDYRAITRSSGA
jgi:hypothetical protein